MTFDLIFNFKILKSDKMCDNHYDCPGHEDEGDLVQCLPSGVNTVNGCCNSYFYNLIEYVHQGRVNRFYIFV